MAPDLSDDAPVPLPITGELDLHTFQPGDIGELIPAWLAECAAHDLREVRIVHGKGTGKLRAAVREALRGHAYVKSFEEGAHNEGGEGVTVAILRS